MSKEKQIEGLIEAIKKCSCVYTDCEQECSQCSNEELYDDHINHIARTVYEAGYRKQSEGELTKAHINAHYEAIYALADMVCQFGYSTTFRKQKAVCDGGLSALECAFGALLDCGCKVNSNGTISLKNLFAFQEEIQAKMKGGE